MIAELMTIRRVEVLGRLEERTLVSYCRNDLHEGPIKQKKEFLAPSGGLFLWVEVSAWRLIFQIMLDRLWDRG
jgi:hypothetical protein